MNEFDISQAEPSADELSVLLDTSFGPGRLARTAERLREANQPVSAYWFCARHSDGKLLGTISYWPIRIGEAAGLLLGPLAVHPDLQGQGVGQDLMRASLAVIDISRFAFTLLVGDLPYYERVGFTTAPALVSLPGPVDPARLLVLGDAAICADLSGMVRPAPELC